MIANNAIWRRLKKGRLLRMILLLASERREIFLTYIIRMKMRFLTSLQNGNTVARSMLVNIQISRWNVM
jgi:hypothetical protein